MEGFLLLLVNEAVGDEVVEKRAEASPASLCCVRREQGGAPELYRAAPLEQLPQTFFMSERTKNEGGYNRKRVFE